MALWADRLAKLAQALATAGTVPETSISTAETDTDLSLRPDGVGGVEWGPGGGTNMSLQSFIREEFFHTATPYDGSIVVSASGSGTGIGQGTGDQSHPGLVTLNTGTTTTGRTGLISGTSTSPSIRFGGARTRFGAIERLVTLSDGTETFTVWSGFGDSAVVEPVDGAYFRYTHSVNGGRWEAVTRNNNAETATDTGITADTTWHRFEIDVAADGSGVTFSIDGTLVATNTTNIPTTAGRETGLLPMNIIKAAGTTNRTCQIDAYWYIFDFTTPR